jgi:hypothetical protein
MFYSVRRSRARFILLPLLAIHLGACTTTNHVLLSPALDQAEMTGMTTWNGADVAFEPKGARIAHDTLYARSATGPVIMSTDSIRRVWVSQPDSKKTTTLIVVVAMTVVVAVLFNVVDKKYAACSQPNPSGC